MSRSEAIGVAVVGAGGWGKNHVRNYAALPAADLRYICDRDEAIRTTMAATYPSVSAVGDFDAVLSDASVSAVVVATPAPSHFELAEAALVAGRDVFVEKPLCLSGAQARSLCSLAERNERILMVGHLLLYHPAVERLKKLVHSGELGDVLYIYAQRVNLGVVRREENAWWSLAPHDISVANYLLGAPPQAVSATGSCYLQPERGVEDVVFATMHYPGGRMAHIHVSWLDPHKIRKLTVVGDRKMAVFDDTSPDQKLAVFDKGVEPPATVSYEEGVRIRTGDIRIPALKMAEPLRRECSAFLDAVRTRKAPVADGQSGLEVVRTLEAGAASLARGGARIELDGGS
ncbi:MAG: Gfo/Idh/MocA family oxidoreductase [Myxococcales bacterium]|nr:Gfo/Idh/MocA family oxidoreductase [Myxococcales bacterium]